MTVARDRSRPSSKTEAIRGRGCSLSTRRRRWRSGSGAVAPEIRRKGAACHGKSGEADPRSGLRARSSHTLRVASAAAAHDRDRAAEGCSDRTQSDAGDVRYRTYEIMKLR